MSWCACSICLFHWHPRPFLSLAAGQDPCSLQLRCTPPGEASSHSAFTLVPATGPRPRQCRCRLFLITTIYLREHLQNFLRNKFPSCQEFSDTHPDRATVFEDYSVDGRGYRNGFYTPEAIFQSRWRAKPHCLGLQIKNCFMMSSWIETLVGYDNNSPSSKNAVIVPMS